MHKLVILIEEMEDRSTFDDAWPQFLHHAEQMPGLMREATSQVESALYGRRNYMLIHEMFFATRDAAQAAMASPQGREAGRLLQGITGGRLVLLFADHKEDNLQNIRQHTTRAD